MVESNKKRTPFLDRPFLKKHLAGIGISMVFATGVALRVIYKRKGHFTSKDLFIVLLAIAIGLAIITGIAYLTNKQATRDRRKK